MPPFQNNPSIPTDFLLKKLNWHAIKKYCDTTKGHYASSEYYLDSLWVEYRYNSQGNSSYFNVTSYKDLVLEYQSNISDGYQPSSSFFFDKKVWMMYVSDMLPDLPKHFNISIDERVEILKAYYNLLNLDSRDEYGWICEYSTVGSAPDKRRSIITLIHSRRTDLLKKLWDFSNLQTQLYVIDALIFIDYEAKKAIKEKELEIKVCQKDIELLKGNQQKIFYLEDCIKRYKGSIQSYKEYLLNQNDWKKIYSFRDANHTIITCGNSGSYKKYKTSSSELLSMRAIQEIPENYENLKSSGYFHDPYPLY
ncbi:MAG: hypothetical protein MUC49_02515 [Raineya sp.]|nr:hypothetical protein [Raineya sp.]